MPAFSEKSPIVAVGHLGIMLRVHARHEYLGRIFQQIKRLGRGRRITLTIGADRPTPKVLSAISRELDMTSKVSGRFLNVHSLPKIVSPTGARWMEPLLFLHEKHREDAAASGFGPADAGMLWDDDALFTEAGIKEIRGHLGCLSYDRLDVEHRFCWDHPDQYNAAIPTHWSCAVWRQYPGDHFPTSFVVKCPERVARSARVLRLTNVAREYGWLTQEDRDRAFAANKAAGRLDAHTLALVRPPNLKKFDGSISK